MMSQIRIEGTPLVISRVRVPKDILEMLEGIVVDAFDPLFDKPFVIHIKDVIAAVSKKERVGKERVEEWLQKNFKGEETVFCGRAGCRLVL